jgi:dCTP deaminase
MSEAMPNLFSEDDQGREGLSSVAMRTGVLPNQAISTMIRERMILARRDIASDQIQPASLDLRLGPTAYRIRASFLPGPNIKVQDKLIELDAYEIDLRSGAVLERGGVYLVPLIESLALNAKTGGIANPKSTTGRLDILTRLITDGSDSFDFIAAGYQGQLYLEIAPRTFSIVVREGTRLNQIRFRRGSPTAVAVTHLAELHESGQLVHGENVQPLLRDRKMGVTIDLQAEKPGNPVGYRAKKHTDRIDLDRVGFYDPHDFWEPIYQHRKRFLILDPDAFYILVTRELVRVSPDYAAEMIAYDTSVGEYRVHYAGFFDPGFGWNSGAAGAKAVLEVRSHEVPFLLEHGQTVGWLRYERMAARPTRLYGEGIKSNYQNQGLALAKQFRAR